MVERDAVEEPAHVVDRVDRHPHPADLAEREHVVRVVADLGGEVEGHREAGRPLGQEVAVAPVRLLGRGEAGILPHGPAPLPVHVRVDPPGVREGPGVADIL